ncbi:MAG TPA: murein biosynthesis integral membrane protein MurJ [Chloroflexota bacterium]|jgi:putative peptidoglycan lipid II flippase
MVAHPATVPASAPSADRLRKLAGGALVVLTGFLLSRLLGAVRNIVIAAHFGAGPEYGAYVAAIALPDLVFQVLVGGAVGAAFIPIFKSYHATGRDDEAWYLTSSVINIFCAIALVTSVVLAIFARQIMDVWVAGQDAEFRETVASLTRVLLVTPAIFAVSTFCSSVLNSYNRFAIAAMAPLMYNLAIIAAALGLSGTLGIYGLALGAVIGAFLHLLVQLPFCFRLGMRWQPILDMKHPGVREVVRLFAPRVVGLGVVQVNQVFSAIVLASFLGAVSIGFLNYAWQLIMLPLALAMAVGTAVFPTLSEESALENRSGFEQLFFLSLRMILFLTVPASIGLIVLGEPLIRLVFEHGQFDDASTVGVTSAMVFYALGLAGLATVEIVDRVFYARKDTRTPVIAAVLAVGVNVTLSLILMRTGLTFRGLALANSLAALVEAGALLWFLTVYMPGLRIGRLVTPAVRILAASLVMGVPVAWLAAQLDPVLRPYGTPGEAVLLLICAGFGAVVYALVSIAFRSDEIFTLWRLVRR